MSSASIRIPAVLGELQQMDTDLSELERSRRSTLQCCFQNKAEYRLVVPGVTHGKMLRKGSSKCLSNLEIIKKEVPGCTSSQGGTLEQLCLHAG